MPPPDNKTGGSGAHRIPPNVSLTSKTTNTGQSTRRGRQSQQIDGQTVLDFAGRTPAAYASQHGPDGHRKQWWVSYSCPHCSRSHFGRSPERISDGVRLSRCGRKIWLLIMRTYASEAA
jgi:hypothetical protein